MIYNVLFILLTTLYCSFAGQPTSTDQFQVTFFGSATCGECMQIREKLLKPLRDKYPSRLILNLYDTDSDSGLTKLIALEKAHDVTCNAAQMLFLPDTFLCGAAAIMQQGRTMVEERMSRDTIPMARTVTPDSVNLTHVLQSKAVNWGFFLGTLAAGIADGVNPCAIATMIFLISFMATRKRSRGQILLIGLTYSTTVFLTYLAMGLGLKGILEQIKGYYLISSLIRWGAFGLALTVAVLSFKDAFVYHRSGKTEKITLQLPKTIKLRIHKIISGNLSGSSLVIGSIITGFLVTLLEAICTGQMYIPYIVAMTQHSSVRLTGYLYLIFYNFLFVLPLLIVMVLAYFGLKWNILAKQTQQNMVPIKIVLGVIMLALALYLAIGSGFLK